MVSPAPSLALVGRVLGDAAGRAVAPSISIALDAATYAARWRERFPERATPPVDLGTEVVFVFDVLVGSGCPDLDYVGLGYAEAEGLLFGIFDAPEPQPHCGDVAADHTLIVAIRRTDLPTGLIHVRLMREFQVCSDCGREAEQIELSL